jgi:hypothetical protein
MNTVTILTLIVTAAYLYHIGVIPSISDSYRTIKDKRVYHIFFFVSAVLVGCQSIYSRDELDIPYLVAGFCFYGISMAAAFWNKGEGRLHVVFTYTAIAIGLTITIIRIWPYWGYWSLVLAGVGIVTALVLRGVKNSTYWQEIAAYVIVFGPILTV